MRETEATGMRCRRWFEFTNRGISGFNVLTDGFVCSGRGWIVEWCDSRTHGSWRLESVGSNVKVWQFNAINCGVFFPAELSIADNR